MIADERSTEAGLKPGSKWAVALGLVGLSIGTALWFLVPRPLGHYIHGCVFVPMAAGGALCCGAGILVSWRRIHWPLRVLGILIIVAALSPLVLIASAVLAGIMNWPDPR
jgi:hypothetical protein